MIKIDRDDIHILPHHRKQRLVLVGAALGHQSFSKEEMIRVVFPDGGGNDLVIGIKDVRHEIGPVFVRDLVGIVSAGGDPGRGCVTTRLQIRILFVQRQSSVEQIGWGLQFVV